MRREGLSPVAGFALLIALFALVQGMALREWWNPPGEIVSVDVDLCGCDGCAGVDWPTTRWQIETARGMMEQSFREMNLETDASDMTDRELCRIWRSLFANSSEPTTLPWDE